jgi:hypothetical protein
LRTKSFDHRPDAGSKLDLGLVVQIAK